MSALELLRDVIKARSRVRAYRVDMVEGCYPVVWRVTECQLEVLPTGLVVQRPGWRTCCYGTWDEASQRARNLAVTRRGYCTRHGSGVVHDEREALNILWEMRKDGVLSAEERAAFEALEVLHALEVER